MKIGELIFAKALFCVYRFVRCISSLSFESTAVLMSFTVSVYLFKETRLRLLVLLIEK